MNPLKITAFSDLHGQFPAGGGYESKLTIVNPCDILIFAGDFSWVSGYESCILFMNWLKTLPATHKIVVPGNHDYDLEKIPVTDINTHILIHNEVEIEGIKFFGTPYTPLFCDWNYMLSEEELKIKFDEIPSDTEILISHGPPAGILDKFADSRIGSEALAKRIKEIDPSLVIFGHNHAMGFESKDGINYLNVSLLDHDYAKVNAPFEIEYFKEEEYCEVLGCQHR